jgi:hypothetical protein
MASLPRITVHAYLTPSYRSPEGEATYSVGVMNLTPSEVTLIRSCAENIERARSAKALRGKEIDAAWDAGIANMSAEERREAAEMAMAARLSSNVVPEGATDAAQRRDRDIEMKRAKLEEAFGVDKAFAWARAMRAGTVSVQSFEDATRWINGGSWINVRTKHHCRFERFNQDTLLARRVGTTAR